MKQKASPTFTSHLLKKKKKKDGNKICHSPVCPRCCKDQLDKIFKGILTLPTGTQVHTAGPLFEVNFFTEHVFMRNQLPSAGFSLISKFLEKVLLFNGPNLKNLCSFVSQTSKMDF